MTKKKSTKKEDKGAVKKSDPVITAKKVYFFPVEGKSVKADSMEEAKVKLKQAKEKK